MVQRHHDPRDRAIHGFVIEGTGCIRPSPTLPSPATGGRSRPSSRDLWDPWKTGTMASVFQWGMEPCVHDAMKAGFNGRWFAGSTNTVSHGYQTPCDHGAMDPVNPVSHAPWNRRPTVPWMTGGMASCRPRSIGPCCHGTRIPCHTSRRTAGGDGFLLYCADFSWPHASMGPREPPGQARRRA